MEHAFFWSVEKRLAFIQEISDRIEIEPKEFGGSKLIKALERNARKVVNHNWTRKLSRLFMDNMSKKRIYNTATIQGLLRAIRNAKHHFHELDKSVQLELGARPEQFLEYWTSRFPMLFTYTFTFAKSAPEMQSILARFTSQESTL